MFHPCAQYNTIKKHSLSNIIWAKIPFKMIIDGDGFRANLQQRKN
jgi:hypothetical protein